eukprot:CAMPEP_0181214398 /NCGR_PEP_ID=MMETSP1096-20121128/25430_1 /TAXON_ID=156174 ORGANISM="Chrysochromulina ericina, Strain CCMP281" /NCGR_SAMPLE_ID=MMETSP1096 /ASSEMBLY_ACC=CAM_ASM_000453 /LENGTH=190 /DNA_ID=CAMNT_0023306127 /DNA_START=221 /DNA_END=794 /DNA_ORIENTATION=-
MPSPRPQQPHAGSLRAPSLSLLLRSKFGEQRGELGLKLGVRILVVGVRLARHKHDTSRPLRHRCEAQVFLARHIHVGQVVLLAQDRHMADDLQGGYVAGDDGEPALPLRTALTTSFTPLRIHFAFAAFFTVLSTFFDTFLSASGFAMGETSRILLEDSSSPSSSASFFSFLSFLSFFSPSFLPITSLGLA